MKEKILTYALLSFVLLNIWSLYMFFDYFIEKDEILHSLGIFLNFVYTAVTAVVLGGLLVLIRIIFHFSKKTNPLETNFFYILAGIFNANIFIIWLVSLSLHILELGSGRLQVCAFFSLLLSVVILSDVFKSFLKR